MPNCFSNIKRLNKTIKYKYLRNRNMEIYAVQEREMNI